MKQPVILGLVALAFSTPTFAQPQEQMDIGGLIRVPVVGYSALDPACGGMIGAASACVVSSTRRYLEDIGQYTSLITWRSGWQVLEHRGEHYWLERRAADGTCDQIGVIATPDPARTGPVAQPDDDVWIRFVARPNVACSIEAESAQ